MTASTSLSQQNNPTSYYERTFKKVSRYAQCNVWDNLMSLTLGSDLPSVGFNPSARDRH